MNTINDKINAARSKAAELTATTQAETERVNAELAALEAEAAKINAAEEQRVTERGRIWAADYIANATERTQHRTELREAEKALRDALADAPWVQALKDWHLARRRADLIREREDTARNYLGMNPTNGAPAPESAAAWNNGVPSPDFLLKPLLDVIDGTTQDQLDQERTARTEEIHTLLHAPDRKGDPISALPVPKPGAEIQDPRRIEVTRLRAADGTPILAHRSLDTNSVRYTLEDGTPYVAKDIVPKD